MRLLVHILINILERHVAWPSGSNLLSGPNQPIFAQREEHSGSTLPVVTFLFVCAYSKRILPKSSFYYTKSPLLED